MFAAKKKAKVLSTSSAEPSGESPEPTGGVVSGSGATPSHETPVKDTPPPAETEAEEATMVFNGVDFPKGGS